MGILRNWGIAEVELRANVPRIAHGARERRHGACRLLVADAEEPTPSNFFGSWGISAKNGLGFRLSRWTFRLADVAATGEVDPKQPKQIRFALVRSGLLAKKAEVSLSQFGSH